MWVLTIGYPGGRTRQFSLRSEQVDQDQQPQRHFALESRLGIASQTLAVTERHTFHSCRVVGPRPALSSARFPTGADSNAAAMLCGGRGSPLRAQPIFWRHDMV